MTGMTLNKEVLSGVEELMNKPVLEGKCPGLYATIFNGDEVLLEKGVGQFTIGNGEPSSNTSFRIASCTKSFTITALLILRDRGALDLNQPITDFVEEYRFSEISTFKEIPTVGQLAAMSSGLPSDDPWADRQESISGKKLREIVSRGVHTTNRPGAIYQYSNLGFALLGQVIEKASGVDYREFVTTEILKPLGMNDSGFDNELFPKESLAIGYRKSGETWLELPFSASGAFSCIGGLFSSARDLRTWSRWMHSALTANPKGGPLSTASRHSMQQIVTSAPFNTHLATLPANAHRAAGYGLGLFIEFDPKYGQFVSHSGGYPGFSSHMRWHVPTGLSVVVLENATYSGAWATATGILDYALEKAGFELPLEDKWPQTYELAKQADSLVRQWSASLANEIFEENVDMDVPFAERESNIKKLIDEVGGLTASESLNEAKSASDSPLHFLWDIPGKSGSLRCEIRLNPITPIRIQTLNVKKAEK
ncbi:unannotated protein [freshwater metagenome]|uniref:Unannotated protein n=2 Tax=freshwater metagenome TaxID=449393 RepID=A0A6J7M1V3_9ZZZZ